MANNLSWIVLVHLVESPNVTSAYCNLQKGNFCVIIGDTHKFLDHCLIPLDPCKILEYKSDKILEYKSNKILEYKSDKILEFNQEIR